MHRATFAAALGLIVCSMGGADEGPRSKTHAVTIEAMRFEPEHLTVAPGDTIVWNNKDPVAHTATSKAGRFDSEIIPAGKSWSLTVKRRGEFVYLCTLHPTMKGTLRVK